MTAGKIAVTLPPELIAAARAAVRDGHAASVSAYVAEALARRVREDGLNALLDDLDRELGPPGAEDYGWADRALGRA